jgi:hypothetical protein
LTEGRIDRLTDEKIEELKEGRKRQEELKG